MTAESLTERLESFVERCSEAGVSATHQRRIIYRVLVESDDHPSPETVYERVRREIPSISQATVYNNIHKFVELGLLAEVSKLHQTSRLDANLERHHHLVCVQCKKVVDYYDAALDKAKARDREPHGFEVREYHVEVHGLCPECRRQAD